MNIHIRCEKCRGKGCLNCDFTGDVTVLPVPPPPPPEAQGSVGGIDIKVEPTDDAGGLELTAEVKF